MNTKKKALLLSLCMVLLIAASVFGTMAYLTDNEKAENTFTVGNVSITLDEAKVNKDGTAVTPAERTDKNDYHLVPGGSYIKDPTVTVEAGSDKAYVRMIVTIATEKKAALEAISKDGTVLGIFSGLDITNWKLEDQSLVTVADCLVYEFRYDGIVDGTRGALEPLFTTIDILGTVTNKQLTDLGGFDINIEAQAIQASGFADDADLAWASFSK